MSLSKHLRWDHENVCAMTWEYKSRLLRVSFSASTKVVRCLVLHWGVCCLVPLPLRGNKNLKALLWQPGLVVGLGVLVGLRFVMDLGLVMEVVFIYSTAASRRYKISTASGRGLDL